MGILTDSYPEEDEVSASHKAKPLSPGDPVFPRAWPGSSLQEKAEKTLGTDVGKLSGSRA